MIDKLIDFVISILDLFRFWVVVDPDEQGVMIRMGAFHKELESGTWYLKRPFQIDRERLMKVVPDTYNLSPQALTTKDGKQIVVSLVVKFRISNTRKALLEVTDMEGVIKDCSLGATAQLVQANDWETVRSAAFADELTKAARPDAQECGVKILRVKFADVSTTFNHTQMQVG
jgi:regulator of protease activity HflC (stomatin/prohibitin superfamily)